MKIGIIGSGVVAQTLGAKLVELGHDVALGTRDPKKLDEKKNLTGSLKEWLAKVKNKAKVVTFPEAAAHGELLISALHGQVTLEALKAAGLDKVGTKVLIETANELDFSKGGPQVLASQERCLAESVQKAFPNLKVVKCFNTISAPVMVDPKAVGGGDHTLFVSGNDKEAKGKVVELAKSFGWKDVFDLGDISAARGQEMYMALWVRLYGAVGKPMVNVKVVR